MAFADPSAAFTNDDAVAMIMEEWTPIVNEPNFPKAVAANFFTDLSQFAQAGVDILHVPDIYTNVFTAQTQSVHGDGVVDASPTQVDTQLTIDTHKYVAWIIGDLTMRQIATFYNLNEKYAREAKNILTQELEDDLFGLWSSLSTTTIGDTATVLTDFEIREAIEALDVLNYDLRETAFFVHPTIFWQQLASVAKYYTESISDMAIIRTGGFGPMDFSRGLRGHLYDQPVYVSTRVVGLLQTYRNLFAHPSALGFAIQTPSGGSGGGGGGFSQQMNPVARIRVQADYLLQNLGTLAVVDIIYGVAVLREPAAVLVNANISAGIS